MTVRAVTTEELALLRGAGQHSETYLWVHNPATVYSARVNQATFTDPVIELTYDGGSGTYTNILPGMTLRIGSAAGLDDLGKMRIRKAASTTKLYVGSAGGIAWADNLYLTVVDDFELWWKRAVLQGNNTYLMDEDVVYGDQHSALDPMPNMGCDAAAWLSAGTATVAWHGTPVVLGSTISGHSWSVTPATGVTITNGTTANASMAFTVAGSYRVSYTVTAANGKTVTGHRYAYIFDAAHPPVTKFSWRKIGGGTDAGGYTSEVTVWDGAGLTQIRPGARVLMFARDWFGATQQNLGPLAGRENVLLAGWIAGEAIEGDPKLGSVRFTVAGGAGMMKQISGQPVSTKVCTGAPVRWTRFEANTLDHFLWHVCHWRSTIDAVMDVFLTGETRMAGEFITEADYLWDKLFNVSQHRMVARPGVNRYGQLFVRRDPQSLLTAERATLTTVQTLEKQDWVPPLDFERVTATRVASLEMSGAVCVGEGTANLSPLYTKAPGTALLRTGSYEVKDNLMLTTQAQANELVGMLLAQKNNPYPSVPVTLKGNDRFVDFAEPCYVAMNLAAGDTPRGITWSGQKLVPLRVELVWDAKTGRMHTEVECEAETTGAAGVEVAPPQPPMINTPPVTPPPGGGFITPPPNIWFPPIIPPPTTNLDCVGDLGFENGPYGMYWDKNLIQAGETAYCYFPCGIRPATDIHLPYVNKSFIRLTALWGDDAYSNFLLTAIDSNKADLISPISVVGDTLTFGPTDPTPVAGFKLALEAVTGECTPGSHISSGSVSATNTSGATIGGLTIGKLYCVEGTGGPVTLSGGQQVYDLSFSNDNGATWDSGVGLAYVGGYFFTMETAAWNFQAENIDGHHGRLYFVAEKTYIKCRFGGAEGIGQTGTLGWTLKSAHSARNIQITQSQIYNICQVL